MSKGKAKRFEEGWEIELIGSTNHFSQLVIQAARESDINGYHIEAKSVVMDVDHARYLLISRQRINPSRVIIGTLTFMTIGPNRTILRIPPRAEWSRDVTGDDLVLMANIEHDSRARAFYDAQFKTYLEALYNTLKHYHLQMTWIRKLWKWTRELASISKDARP